MRSQKLTPVAVLRSLLGLSVEEFANVVGKAPSTIKSLETGRLALSEETALSIANQTGVAVAWLLEGNAKQKPYTSLYGRTEPYTRNHFEEVQWTRLRHSIMPQRDLTPLPPELRLWPGLDVISEWLSVHHHAYEDGNAEFARYLMRQAIKPLIKRFGRDDKAMLEANKDARIILANGQEFCFHFQDPESSNLKDTPTIVLGPSVIARKTPRKKLQEKPQEKIATKT